MLSPPLFFDDGAEEEECGDQVERRDIVEGRAVA